MSRAAKIGAIIAFLALVATVIALAISTHGIRPIPATPTVQHGGASRLHTDCSSPNVPSPSVMRVGVALGGAVTQARLTSFAHAADVRPSVVEIYRQFGKSFSWDLVCLITRNGALPLIDWSPSHQSVRSIARGKYDAYLRSYAKVVDRFKLPVAISFGHEMNGDWYSWGWKHTQPADFIAAWRHIHEIFAQVGADNVTWVWSVSPKGPVSSAQSPWWPGSAYVTWVGLDAYYRKATSTFGTFTGMLSRVRAFTRKPALITETAVAPNRNAAKQVRSLFIGVESHPGVLGFIWFDQDRKRRWRLEGDTAASAEFDREIRALGVR